MVDIQTIQYKEVAPMPNLMLFLHIKNLSTTIHESHCPQLVFCWEVNYPSESPQ
jgi:hypothetical protein